MRLQDVSKLLQVHMPLPLPLYHVASNIAGRTHSCWAGKPICQAQGYLYSFCRCPLDALAAEYFQILDCVLCEGYQQMSVSALNFCTYMH